MEQDAATATHEAARHRAASRLHTAGAIPALPTNPPPPSGAAPPPPDPAIILVLQGGGALGSYQAGVFEALTAARLEPGWVAGVSIGAINASLIAGNPPGRRVERLRAFWQRVTTPAPIWLDSPAGEDVERTLGTAAAVLFGQAGFFRPRTPLDWADSPTSLYDSAELRATLEELVDFDRINDGPMRLSVGAVNVETGNLVCFDSANMRIGPEHIMASGALPPGLPSVEIDGQAYWDGGLVSNTPLQYVLAEQPRRRCLVFQVDLFPSRGQRPANLDEVTEREKDIRFSSRTRTGTNDAGEAQNLRRQMRIFLDRLPPELRDDPVAVRLSDEALAALVDVVHLIYRPDTPQGAQKDLQFGRATMERRWAQGLADAAVSLAAAPWTQPVGEDVGFRSFDVFAPAAVRPGVD